MSWNSKNDKDITHLSAGPLPPRKDAKKTYPKLPWKYNKEGKVWYALTDRKFKCIVYTIQPVYIAIYDETGMPRFMLTETMTAAKAKRIVEQWIAEYNEKEDAKPLSRRLL